MGQQVSKAASLWPPSLGCANCWTSPVQIESSAVETPPGELPVGPVHDFKVDDTTTLQTTQSLRRFSFNDLKACTRNFRPDSMLGRGGFGCVFKGWIDENGTGPARPGTGLTVAVKILNQDSLQGHKEWLAEVNFLGRLRHPHIVELIGCCIEQEQRLLVYEYMERGSLEQHLFGRNSFCLSWNRRMKIALGAAKGLEFLHNGEKPIIFRDFKTPNILLDADYNAKLSDFGLARDGPRGAKTHVSTAILGTHGYAAPEYVMTGRLNFKSDIYSFGVVLLEILTGIKSVRIRKSGSLEFLTEWTRPYLAEKKKVLGIVDHRLNGLYSIEGALKVADLARRCISREQKLRPLMTEVVRILEKVQNYKDVADPAPAASQGSLSSPLTNGKS